MRLELYDPRTDTAVGWDFDKTKGEFVCRITLKKAVQELAQKIIKEQRKDLVEVLYNDPKFVIQVTK